jgi:hypothetical protein
VLLEEVGFEVDEVVAALIYPPSEVVRLLGQAAAFSAERKADAGDN